MYRFSGDNIRTTKRVRHKISYCQYYLVSLSRKQQCSTRLGKPQIGVALAYTQSTLSSQVLGVFLNTGAFQAPLLPGKDFTKLNPST